MNNEDFLSIKEFAAKLNVHPNTIRRAIKKGRINAFKINSNAKSSYRIPRSEINRIALFDMKEMVEKLIDERIKKK